MFPVLCTCILVFLCNNYRLIYISISFSFSFFVVVAIIVVSLGFLRSTVVMCLELDLVFVSHLIV